MALNLAPQPWQLNPTSIDIKVLTCSAMKAYQILEPWMQAKVGPQASGLEEFDRLVAGIRTQGSAFVSAIELSVKTTQFGVVLARNFDALQKGIRESTNADQCQVLQYIEELKASVLEARKGAEEIVQKFQAVRRGVLDLTHVIPLIVDLAVAKLYTTCRSRKAHTTAARLAQSVATFLGGAGSIAAMIASPEPILAIVLPIVLPILEWASGKLADAEDSKAAVRRKEQLSLENTLIRIEEASADLSNLLDGFRLFTTWWGGVELELDSIAERIHRRSLTTDQIMLISQDQLESICQLYGDYSFEIGRVVDQYPCRLNDDANQEDSLVPVRPSSTVTSLSNGLVEWEAAFQTLRSIVASIKQKYQRELRTLLDDIWHAMSQEFAAHIILLQKLAIQTRDSTHPSELQDMTDSISEISYAARASLKQHLGTTQLLAALMERLRFLAIDKDLNKTANKYQFYHQVSTALETPSTQQYISTRAESFTDNTAILERFVAAGDNVGTTCTYLVLIDFSASKIGRPCIEAALATISHLHIPDADSL